MKKRTLNLSAAVLALALAAAGGHARAAVDIPCSTAKLIVPWAPGGETDIVARLFVEAANKEGAKPQLQVVNVGGQGGNKGAKDVLKAKPDGCTLLMIHESTITSFLTGRVDFTWSAFTPVALLTRSWAIIGANKDVPYDDLKGLAAYAKAHPKTVIAGATLGSTSHFSILLWADAADVDLKYVSYEGTRERMTALLSGNVQLGEVSTTAAVKYLQSHEIKALGILAPERDKLLPSVPTAAEQGYKVDFATSRGIALPKGATPEMVDHFAAIFRKAAESADLKKQMEAKGTDIVFKAGADYAAFMEDMTTRMKKAAERIEVPKS